MKPEQIKKIATTISDLMFTDGGGAAADRLALKFKSGTKETEGGGWCKQAIYDLIVFELQNQTK